MDEQWISSSVNYSLSNNGLTPLFDNMAVVQFVHRYVAYAVVIMFISLFYKARKYHVQHADKLLSSEKISAPLHRL